METTWHRYNNTIVGESQEPGTATVFFDYDLLNWTLGVRAENDPCWISLHLQIGPVAFEVCYWRFYPRHYRLNPPLKRPTMCKDFCLEHGFEFMEKKMGEPVARCWKCEKMQEVNHDYGRNEETRAPAVPVGTLLDLG